MLEKWVQEEPEPPSDNWKGKRKQNEDEVNNFDQSMGKYEERIWFLQCLNCIKIFVGVLKRKYFRGNEKDGKR